MNGMNALYMALFGGVFILLPFGADGLELHSGVSWNMLVCFACLYLIQLAAMADALAAVSYTHLVTYDRSERFAGESKYPLKKMLSFAVDGITSFSVKPLRLITTVGVVIFVMSLLMLLYTLISWIAGHTVIGWTSTLASIWMIGGIQLLSLGVIGEYIGKIYNETKRRPRFIIDRYLNARGEDPVVDR